MGTIRYLLLVLIVWKIYLANCTFAQELSVDEAVHVLRITKPLEANAMDLYESGPVERRAAGKLYDQQMKAINILRLSKDLSIVAVLIPYLGYPSKYYNPFRHNHLDFDPRAENVNLTRQRWPVLSAILDIPGAAKVLQSYALDVKNPTDDRVTAFFALRYENDAAAFKTVADKMRVEFANAAPMVKDILDSIENQQAWFDGAQPVVEENEAKPSAK